MGHDGRAGYTAVLSIHGIGRHPRFETIGRLSDALLNVFDGAEVAEGGDASEALPDIEPSRDPAIGDVSFLRLIHRERAADGSIARRSRIHLHEVSWSSLTRAGVSLLPLMLWAVLRLEALAALRSGDWLAIPRVRLARLGRVNAEAGMDVGVRESCAALEEAYRAFADRIRAVRRRSEIDGDGSFAAFEEACEGRFKGAEHVSATAALERWQRAALPSEERMRRVALRFMQAAVPLLLTSAAVLGILSTRDRAGAQLWADAVLLLLPALVLLVVASGYGFLTRIFSDVRFWVALNENDRHWQVREDILERACGTLRHLLGDPRCRRVVVVAHSLGTAIAHDSLRRLGRHNHARRSDPAAQIPLHKVSHLITLGSPIDKISALFEQDRGSTFVQRRLREEALGDAASFGAAGEGRPGRLLWINYWDEADPVADPLQTPLGSASGREAVDLRNIPVVNSELFDPLDAHLNYDRNPAVVGDILAAVLGRPIDADRPHDVTPDAASERRANRRMQAILYFSYCSTMALLAATSAEPLLLLPTFCLSIFTALSGLGLVGFVRARRRNGLLRPSR